jgi:transposase
MARRSYDKQFKIAAVKLVLEDNMTVAEVSKELDIHYNSLYRWISEYEEYGESAFPGHGTALYSYQYEIKKLKAENLELRKELELLKKFQAFLKKKTPKISLYKRRREFYKYQEGSIPAFLYNCFLLPFYFNRTPPF